jgi:hypothetical protein
MKMKASIILGLLLLPLIITTFSGSTIVGEGPDCEERCCFICENTDWQLDGPEWECWVVDCDGWVDEEQCIVEDPPLACWGLCIVLCQFEHWERFCCGDGTQIH